LIFYETTQNTWQNQSLKKRSFFPTLIYEFELPDAQNRIDRLLQLIYAERDADQSGLDRSNYTSLGGWHSRINLHKSPEYASLVKTIESSAGLISDDLGYDMKQSLRIGTMWSIIYPPGSSNSAHIHPGCLWSGVLYVQAPEESGKISFIEPRTANLILKPKYIPRQKRPVECRTKISFTPVAGKIFMFPSWLYHGVAPNMAEEEGTDGERIIISFNLSQKKG
jgi:uncharacterized protein (TIGR02466 family)